MTPRQLQDGENSEDSRPVAEVTWVREEIHQWIYGSEHLTPDPSTLNPTPQTLKLNNFAGSDADAKLQSSLKS